MRHGMEGIVLAIVVLLPWAFGGVDPVFDLLLSAALATLVAMWAAMAIASGKFTILRDPITFVLFLIFLLGVVQLIPLPSGLVRLISPGSGDVRTAFYPTVPEQLTATEQAAGAPAWATISVYPHATRTELYHWLGVIIVFAAVRNHIATTNSLLRLSLVMLVNGCLLSLLGLAQFFSGATTHRGGIYWSFMTQGVAFGPFINRNHFAAYINICIALGIGILIWLGPTETDRKRRYMIKANAPTEQGEELASVFSPFTVLHSPTQLWTCVGLAIMLAGLVCSLSRGGVATLLLAVIVTLCLRITWPLRFRRLEVWIIPAILMIGLFAWVGFRPLETRLGGLLKGPDALTDSRWELWTNLISIVPRFLAFGAGYGVIPYVEPQTRAPGQSLDRDLIVDHAHNDYLDALVEGGIIRFALTLLLVGLVFVSGFRAIRKYSNRTPGALATGAMIGFLAFAFHSFVDFGSATPAVAALATVVAAQLVSMARHDPTKPPSSGHARVVSLTLGPFSRLLVGVGALTVGGILVLHSWQIDRVYRLKAAAYRVVQKQSFPDHEQAIKYLALAARIDPTDADLQSELGQEYLELGRSERALLKSEARFKHQLGLLALSVGSRDAVRAAAPALLTLDRPKSSLPPSQAARIYETAVLPGLRHLALARQMCPLLPRPHMRFAAHANDLYQPVSAAPYWERATKLAPCDPDLWYFSGTQQLRDGHVDEGLAQFRRSLEISPKHLDEIVDASAPLLGTDLRTRADQLLKRVLPDNPLVLYRAAKRLDPGLSAKGPVRPLLTRGINLLTSRTDNLTADDYHLKALLHQSVEDDDAALRAFDLALGMKPTESAWRMEYIDLLIELRKWPLAKRELEFLKRQLPNHQAVIEKLDRVQREIDRSSISGS